MLKVHSIETFGTHEGPGIRLVVFLQGCNFKCLYCHNPDTHDMSGGQSIAFAKIVEMAKEQEHYFQSKGGITVSGGEPLLQAERLTQFFKSLKKQKIHTALDTNGSILDDQVKELLEYTDLVLLDVKHIDKAKHRQVAGAEIDTVLEFADYLKDIGKPFWLRYVLVPGLTDAPEDLKRLGEYFQHFGNLERLEILPYHNLGVYKYEALSKTYQLAHLDLPTPGEVEVARKVFEPYFKKTIVRH